MWGDKDALITKADQDALLAGIHGSRLVVYPSTGHAPHWEEPERFARDLVGFLQSRSSAPAAPGIYFETEGTPQ